MNLKILKKCKKTFVIRMLPKPEWQNVVVTVKCTVKTTNQQLFRGIKKSIFFLKNQGI